MKLSEFIQELQRVEREVNYNAHPSISDCISFSIETEDNILELTLDQIDFDQALGCGCVLGAIVRLVPTSKKLKSLLESQHFDIEL